MFKVRVTVKGPFDTNAFDRPVDMDFHPETFSDALMAAYVLTDDHVKRIYGGFGGFTPNGYGYSFVTSNGTVVSYKVSEV